MFGRRSSSWVVFMLGISGLARAQEVGPVVRELVPPHGSAAPKWYSSVLDAVTAERKRWIDQDLTVDAAGRGVRQDQAVSLARETSAVLSRLSARDLQELREREAKDSRRHLNSHDVLRCALFACASESWIANRPDFDRESDDRASKPAIGDLIRDLREAASAPSERGNEAEGSHRMPTDEDREIDECVRGFRESERALPYLVFAALNDPICWERAEMKRGEFLEKLMFVGEESRSLAGCVLLALSRPLADGLAATSDPKSRVASHLVGIHRGVRRLGFEARHLDIALDILERAEKDDSPLAPIRRDYAAELLLRIRDELDPPIEDGIHFGNSKAEVEAWKVLALTLPWPELKRRAETFLKAVATDDFSHPNDESLAAMAEKRARSGLSPEETEAYRKLRSQRYVDVRSTLLGMLIAVEAALPVEQALGMQNEFVRELNANGKDSLRDGVVAHSLERTFQRDPMAAKHLLDRAVLENRLEQDPFVHRVAIAALVSGESGVSGGREIAITAAIESLDPGVRCAALASPAYLTESESERLVSKSIDDLLEHPTFAKGDARAELSLGVAAHIALRANQGADGKSWAGRMAFRSFESGLWQTTGEVSLPPGMADSLVMSLTVEQVDELEACGRLPGWVKERRNRP